MKDQYGDIVKDLQKISKRVQNLQEKKTAVRKKILAHKDDTEIKRIRKIIDAQ